MRLVEQLLHLNAAIRYVAVYRGGRLTTVARADTRGASSAESDRYEELLVNPTLLKLTTQRGSIDCGGMKYLLIRYGNFFQLVVPRADGHVSVAIEAGADVADVVGRVRDWLDRHDDGGDGLLA